MTPEGREHVATAAHRLRDAADMLVEASRVGDERAMERLVTDVRLRTEAVCRAWWAPAPYDSFNAANDARQMEGNR